MFTINEEGDKQYEEGKRPQEDESPSEDESFEQDDSSYVDDSPNENDTPTEDVLYTGYHQSSTDWKVSHLVEGAAHVIEAANEGTEDLPYPQGEVGDVQKLPPKVIYPTTPRAPVITYFHPYGRNPCRSLHASPSQVHPAQAHQAHPP